MSMNLGINLVEVDGATPSLQGTATSVAGFVIRSQRGFNVNAAPRQITNFTQFKEHFGDYVNGPNGAKVMVTYYGAYAIRGFFDNGGTLAYVFRVLETDAVAASADFLTAGSQGTPALKVTAASRGTVDSGEWGNKVSIGITSVSATEFDLTVRYLDKDVEKWSKLRIGGTGAQDPTIINDPNTGSKYIMVEPKNTTNPAPTTSTDAAGKVILNFTQLTGGSDGKPDDTSLQAAFGDSSPFNPYDVQLLACPESATPDLAEAALGYCSKRGDCMFVGHVPDGIALSEVQAYGKKLQKTKAYGALYYPFIQVADPIGTRVWIPPEGHVMGVYARTDKERGIWKAPAGNAAVVNNALDVKTRITDTEHTELVKGYSVNAIRPITGAGIVIDSSRTLSTNTLWLYVNVRLLFNYVETSLRYGLRWVVQEPNDPTLWKKIKFNSVTPFLMGLWRRGAFGPGAPADVFTVQVDEANNPSPNVQQGILNVGVYFYPSRPAETIVITVGQQEGGAKVSES